MAEGVWFANGGDDSTYVDAVSELELSTHVQVIAPEPMSLAPGSEGAKGVGGKST